MASVSAALLLAVAAFLSSFAASRPGEPFHPCNTVFITNHTISSSGSDSDDAPRRSFGFVSNNPTITNFSSSSFDAFDKNLEILLEEASSRGFWPLLLECVATVLAIAFAIFFGVVCSTVIAFFVLCLLRLIWHVLFDGDQSPRKTGHVMIPSMEMESTPAEVGYDGN